MDIESSTQVKAGFVPRIWGELKALPGKFKAKGAELTKSIKKLGQDDPRRIVHSMKVGLALALVSLLFYLRPVYHSFGGSGIWAVLTVVVIFEFTVGATLSKGLNRAFATLLAGALGVGAENLATLFGQKGEPFLLVIFVFLLAATSTFSRFFPRIKAKYDYGVVVFILTFSLVAVSGYRVDEILELAHQRLSTIIIGGATCIFISIFFCPVWAGEDLHNLVSLNLEKIASYLEGFGGEYFAASEEEERVVVTKDDKSFLENYRSVLNSKTTEENLANFARWEPSHGCFRFRHPWKLYLNIGALTRQCAYQIEALNGYLASGIQAPKEFRTKIQEPCTKMSTESSKALRALSLAIKTMTDPSSSNSHIQNAKNAINDIEISLKSALIDQSADILAIVPAAAVASILTEIVTSTKKIVDVVHELSRQAHFKSVVEPTVSAEKLQLHRGSVKPVFGGNGDGGQIIIAIHETSNDFPLKKEDPQGLIMGRKVEL